MLAPPVYSACLPISRSSVRGGTAVTGEPPTPPAQTVERPDKGLGADLLVLVAPGLKTKMEGLFYHYTSSAAFRDIVAGQTLRLSNAAYLNDPQELIYSTRVAREVARDSENELQEPRFRACVDRALGLLDNETELRRWYLVSLSGAEDRLSQWRAYCPSTGGYALGFDGAQLQELATHNRMWPGRVIYYIEEQRRVVSEQLQEWQSYWTKLRSHAIYGQVADDLYDYSFSNALFVVLALRVAFFKASPFAEEEEWRLVGYVSDSPPHGFTDRNGLLSPYVTVRPKNGERLPISRVFVSPNLDASLGRYAAEQVLARAEYPEGLVRTSSFSLRP
jgi:Protein of unknown function (DUF2971)